MKTWKNIGLACIFLIWNTAICAQAHMSLTSDIREAYALVTELKMYKADSVIQHIKKQDPDNKLVYHIENYIDFFTHFINEDKDAFEKVEDQLKERLTKITTQAIDSPYYLFAQAEMELQWALIRFKFNQRLKGGLAVLRAYKLLEENLLLFPDFAENKKSLSIIHALAPFVPSVIRKVLGIKGSIEEGTQEILDFVEKAKAERSLFYREGVVVAAYILFYLNNDQEEAWKLLEEHNLEVEKNPLLTFIYSNIAQKTGKNDLAIQLLETYSPQKDQIPFYYLDLLLGKNKLYRLDSDADVPIRRYLNQFKGKHFIKEGFQKLAWYELVVNEDLEAYDRYINRCLTMGEDLTDEDQQALQEAKSKTPLNPVLLKARLLYDGGYLKRAYDILIQHKEDFQEGNALEEEYTYRMGRVLQGMGKSPQAIRMYTKLIEDFEASSSYYRCNAALQTALILEEQERYAEALNFLQHCLSIDADTYRSSLHQKAKAGIERVRTKPGLMQDVKVE